MSFLGVVVFVYIDALRAVGGDLGDDVSVVALVRVESADFVADCADGLDSCGLLRVKLKTWWSGKMLKATHRSIRSR